MGESPHPPAPFIDTPRGRPDGVLCLHGVDAMIDTHLYTRYRDRFGETFTVSMWAMHPGDTVNAMMRAALAEERGPLSDESIAAAVAELVAARLRR